MVSLGRYMMPAVDHEVLKNRAGFSCSLKTLYLGEIEPPSGEERSRKKYVHLLLGAYVRAGLSSPSMCFRRHHGATLSFTSEDMHTLF